MKKSLRTSIAISAALLVTGASSKSEETYSVRWLKEGLSLVLLLESHEAKNASSRTNLSEEQWRTFHQTIFWLNGFVVGFNASLFVEDNLNPLAFPPNEWLDPRAIAPSILQYIRKNSDLVDDKMRARVLMASWYYDSHPSATNRHKSAARILLEDDE